MARIKAWKLGESDIETLDQQRERLTLERERCRKFRDVAEGVVFKESLVGSSGMSFMLMPEPHHTDEDIERAANYLRGHRDVVDLYYVRIEPVRLCHYGHKEPYKTVVDTPADLAVFRESRANSSVGAEMRKHLGMK